MKYLIWSTLSYGHLQIRDSTTADQAHDQCTPEACECGNSRTHAQLPWFLRKTDENLWKDAKKPPFCRSVFGWVCQVKHSATTVDGSPCFYCLDSEVWKIVKIRSTSTTLRWSHQWSGLGKAWSHGESAGESAWGVSMFPDSKRPELLMSLTAVLLLVIWHFGRSLGLSRTCRERNTINVNILVVDIHRITQIYLGYLYLRTSHHSNFNFSFEAFSQEASTWQLETLAAAGRQESCHSSTAGAAEVLRRGQRWTWTAQLQSRTESKEIRQLGSTYLYGPTLFLHSIFWWPRECPHHLQVLLTIGDMFDFLARTRGPQFFRLLWSHCLRRSFFHYWYIVIYGDLSKSFGNEMVVGFLPRCETTWNILKPLSLHLRWTVRANCSVWHGSCWRWPKWWHGCRKSCGRCSKRRIWSWKPSKRPAQKREAARNESMKVSESQRIEEKQHLSFDFQFWVKVVARASHMLRGLPKGHRGVRLSIGQHESKWHV